MIANFSGMLPLRDPLLLPDINSQLSVNTWLYLGAIRGFRNAEPVYTYRYGDTKQVYRIPGTDVNDFVNSTWLEFPDTYMTVLRNPVVGDQYNRYYFFPSDQYSSSGANPTWPATSPGPIYAPLTNIKAGGPFYSLGVPNPATAPTVTPILITVASLTATADSPAGYTGLTFASTTGIVNGLQVVDETNPAVLPSNATVISYTPTAVGMNVVTIAPGVLTGDTINFLSSIIDLVTTNVAPPGSNSLLFTDTSGIVVGMTVFDSTNPNAIPAGTAVINVTPTVVILNNVTASPGVQINDNITFTAATESRAYLYTWVSAYGEEGPPSPPTVANGLVDGSWTIKIPPAPNDPKRNLANVRLYRTVTDTSGNATYYQVAQFPINTSAVTTITDSALDSSITANNPLSTVDFTPPPAGLQGVVMMANGIAAGFTDDKTVWFSAAYLPHAWPAAYAVTVDYPIVGLTANGSSLNIMTQGSPFIASGVTPATMTIGKITANEPCIARGSIAASGEGAYYCSPNGIQLLNSSGTLNISESLFQKEFMYSLNPLNWAAAKYGVSYLVFIKGTDAPFPTTNGFLIDYTDTNVALSLIGEVTSLATGEDELDSHLNTYTDELTGQVFGVHTHIGVQQWNPPSGNTLDSYSWRSKKFRFTSPQQFKAFMVLFNVPPEVTITLGSRSNDQTMTFNPATQYLIVGVYADGRFIVEREVQVSGETLLITNGFKATVWEFVFIGQVNISFFKAASSVKELRSA